MSNATSVSADCPISRNFFTGWLAPWTEFVSPDEEVAAQETLDEDVIAHEVTDPPVHAVPNHKKFAVIIGIVYENYDFGYIGYADRDAGSVYDLLTGKMGYPKENVVLLQNSHATASNIHKSLEWLTSNPQVDSESEVVFFYSGHGIRNGENTGLNVPELVPGTAIVPFDYPIFDFKKGQGMIWDWQLADFFSRIAPARAWINFDTCSSGGFSRPGITGPNRVVTMSSRVDELSSEIPDAGRGVFTQYLVEEGLARGLSIEDSFVAATPKAAAGYGQNPLIADEYPGTLDIQVKPGS